MPSNLYQLIRYRTIDRCLRDVERDWSWEDLAEACADEIHRQTGETKSISRRTLMYDIDNMRSGKLGYEAPIEYDRKLKSYFYSNSKFGINQVPLKSADLEELNSALMILQQFSGKQGVHGIQESITHLEECLNLKRRGRQRQIIQFDHSLNEPGQKWVNHIYKYIQRSETMTVSYQPFDHEASHIQMSPYLLKEYDNRWFVIGYHHNKDRISVLGLDRIKDLRRSLIDYHKHPDFEPDSYFKDIIGVSYAGSQKKQDIVFRAYGLQNKYIKTNPFHESQSLLEETQDYCDYSLSLVPNFELETKLLSYAERIEVLEPSELRKRLKERVGQLHARYY